MRSLRSLTQGIRLAASWPAIRSSESEGSGMGSLKNCPPSPRLRRTPSFALRAKDGGGGGNRTLCCPFRETAAMRDFRGQFGTGQRVNLYLVALSRPLESPGVLLTLGEILASGGTDVPTPGRFSWIGVAWPQLTKVRSCRRQANMTAAPHRGPPTPPLLPEAPPRPPTLRAEQTRLPFTRSSPSNSRLFSPGPATAIARRHASSSESSGTF